MTSKCHDGEVRGRGKVRVVAFVPVIFAAGMLISACGSSTSAQKSTTTSTSAVLTQQPRSAIWPFVSDAVRYFTPQAAVRSFAQQYVGIPTPLIGNYVRRSARNGSVSIQSRAAGPVTTVFVCRVTGDLTWWVTSATSPDIHVTTPSNLQVIHSPVSTSGSSTANEGVVNVVFREDGSVVPIAKRIVMGGSNGGLGRFHGILTIPSTTRVGGAVTYLTLSAKDGSINEATVVRVRY
jgi:hypothetical protein